MRPSARGPADCRDRRPSSAQTFSQRGFVEGARTCVPAGRSNDPINVAGDLLVREEVFVKPAPWIQFAAGGDVRANTHDQVEELARGLLGSRRCGRRWRSAASARRSPRPLDARRRKAVHPLGQDRHRHADDWFAPRDFLNVIENEFLP